MNLTKNSEVGGILIFHTSHVLPQLHGNLENKHPQNYSSYENQQPSSQLRKQNGFWNSAKA